jgi:3-oxoacyl-(acyl-carrier-protein) synthase
VNLDHPIEACTASPRVKYPSSAVRLPAPVAAVMTNSFGFGGVNSCLVFGRVPDELRAASSS